jgi:hypothetical protein
MATNQPSRITLDHAKAIADAAVSCGLATWDQHRDGALSMTPPLKAKLEEQGVEMLAELTEDQAEVVEAFIAAQH